MPIAFSELRLGKTGEDTSGAQLATGDNVRQRLAPMAI